jgi:hypothetical protein
MIINEKAVEKSQRYLSLIYAQKIDKNSAVIPTLLALATTQVTVPCE